MTATERAASAPTPILPAHIEETVRAIAELHAEHHRRATPMQRVVERLTRVVARPRFLGWLMVMLAVWIGGNLVLQALGLPAPDPAPFGYLQDAGEVGGFTMTVLILITQRREDQLTEAREQLTLELAILSEQKSAKIIALLEELRRDNPLIADRLDPEAEALSTPADPQAVLDAIQESHEGLMEDIDDATRGRAEAAPASPG